MRRLRLSLTGLRRFLCSSLLLITLTLGMSACALVGPDDDPQQVRGVINSVEAPAKIEVGTPFDVMLTGTTGCDQFSHVEQEREGEEIWYVAWAEAREVCPIVAASFSVTKTLRLEGPGIYRIKADEVEATVEVIG